MNWGPCPRKQAHSRGSLCYVQAGSAPDSLAEVDHDGLRAVSKDWMAPMTAAHSRTTPPMEGVFLFMQASSPFSDGNSSGFGRPWDFSCTVVGATLHHSLGPRGTRHKKPEYPLFRGPCNLICLAMEDVSSFLCQPSDVPLRSLFDRENRTGPSGRGAS